MGVEAHATMNRVTISNAHGIGSSRSAPMVISRLFSPRRAMVRRL